MKQLLERKTVTKQGIVKLKELKVNKVKKLLQTKLKYYQRQSCKANGYKSGVDKVKTEKLNTEEVDGDKADVANVKVDKLRINSPRFIPDQSGHVPDALRTNPYSSLTNTGLALDSFQLVPDAFRSRPDSSRLISGKAKMVQIKNIVENWKSVREVKVKDDEEVAKEGIISMQLK